jgi:predicted N-acyltransferase
VTPARAGPALAAREATLDRVDPAAWDALAGGNVYLSHAWLRGFADAAAEEALAVVEDEGGRLVGGVPLSVLPGPNENPRYDAFELCGAPPDDRSRWLPQLVAGGRSGYAGALLRSDTQAAALLVAAIAAHAADCGSACAPYLTRDDAELVAAGLGRANAVVFGGARARLEVEWPDFDGYVASLPASRRSIVRRDLRAFEKGGLSIRTEGLAGRVGELAPLLSNVRRRHGVWGESVAACERYLGACAAPGLVERSVVFLCEEGGRTIAFALAYHFGDTLTMRCVGFDYDRCGDRGEYFNVLFYAPIAHAAAAGLAALDLGVEALDAKLLRGCAAHPIWTVLAPPTGASATSAKELAARSAEAHRAWEERYRPLLRT